MASKKFRLIISPFAEQDIEAAITFYEAQREGLGERFYKNLMGILVLLLKNPLLYAKIVYHFRRAIIRPFPYSLYYSVDEQNETVNVIAIVHHARSKQFIRKTLKR